MPSPGCSARRPRAPCAARRWTTSSSPAQPGGPRSGRAEVRLTIDNSAGILPIDFSEVTVRRTLFRSGDSEYAINGVPCRLLDVQELLSDAGVGRQQHVIVSQGQIDAVLNARPEERRAIIEEAAGVLKFRKRKEKAERRLDATEASLVRVQDLLREVRRQLRPLERQAEAARRHGDLIGELTALRIHVAGREIATLRTKLAAVAASKLDTSTGEADLKSRLATLDTDIMAAGAELTARGDDDVGDRLVVVEQLRERARGLGAVIAERRRALERDRGQLLDADVIASLEADAARHADELADVRRRRRRPRARSGRPRARRAAVHLRPQRRAVAVRPGAGSHSFERHRRGPWRAALTACRRRSCRQRAVAAPGTAPTSWPSASPGWTSAPPPCSTTATRASSSNPPRGRHRAGRGAPAGDDRRARGTRRRPPRRRRAAVGGRRPRRRPAPDPRRRPRPCRGGATRRVRRRARHPPRPRAHRHWMGAGGRSGAR